jgi:hypothetical protein
VTGSFDQQKQQQDKQDNCQRKGYKELRRNMNYIKTIKKGSEFIDFVSSVARRNGMWSIDRKVSTTNLNVLVSVFWDILPLTFDVGYIETSAGISEEVEECPQWCMSSSNYCISIRQYMELVQVASWIGLFYNTSIGRVIFI